MSLILFWAKVVEEDDDENSIFPRLMKMEEEEEEESSLFLGADEDGVRRGGIEGDLCLLRGDGSR